MKLVNLRGECFRNIHALDVELSPHLNVICGDNGSGKSTFLEMIYCLGRGRSFRTHVATPIIQYEKEYCTIFGKIENDQFSTSIGFQKIKGKKTELKVGYDKSPPTLSALSQLLPLQLFHPESHDFLKGGPSLRRKFIDWGLFYTEPRFSQKWQRFHQALKQRNAALSQKHSPASIASWDMELATTGEALSEFRSNYIHQLIAAARDWIELLVGGLPIQFSYESGWDASESLLDTLESNLERDIRYGYTTKGPHRFDLLIQSHELAVENVFSRGEQKRLICALYLAQGHIFKKKTEKGCLYLLDDILSELDVGYQSKILEALMALDAQIFMTSLGASLVQPLLNTKGAKKFHLVKGKVHSDP